MEWATGSGSGSSSTDRPLAVWQVSPVPTPTPIHLASIDIAHHTLIAFPDEIDLSNAAPLLAEARAVADLHADGARDFIIDLTDTRFLDSQGVRLLLDLRRYLADRYGSSLRVSAPRTGVASRVLTLTQLRRDVPVHDNLLEALLAREP